MDGRGIGSPRRIRPAIASSRASAASSSAPAVSSPWVMASGRSGKVTTKPPSISSGVSITGYANSWIMGGLLSFDILESQPELLQHGVQGSCLELVLQVADHGEAGPEIEGLMAPLAAFRYKENLEAALPTNLPHPADELAPLHRGQYRTKMSEAQPPGLGTRAVVEASSHGCAAALPQC